MSIKQTLLPILFLITSILFSQKTYQKTYFINGNLKQEGWVYNNKKNDYWKFYHKKGGIKKEGHFKNNLETKYWYFYGKNSTVEKEGHFTRGKKK
jgi:antitoxin component YwqK of YwqJK toxin-antitoxin module